ncbi:hypothetical protein DPEC_G00203860 [Dallia pectoralis]|uniref:Uncharacterized protein n=1 Tax=Dallia pectoralis TaxID=75939 RepID=A0ACC2G9X9_DALPE|nr:hypothetical protein DPEC_G00203860 [Dallia pectoralis]
MQRCAPVTFSPVSNERKWNARHAEVSGASRSLSSRSLLPRIPDKYDRYRGQGSGTQRAKRKDNSALTGNGHPAQLSLVSGLYPGPPAIRRAIWVGCPLPTKCPVKVSCPHLYLRVVHLVFQLQHSFADPSPLSFSPQHASPFCSFSSRFVIPFLSDFSSFSYLCGFAMLSFPSF